MKVFWKTMLVLLVALLPLSSWAQMADRAEVKEVTQKYDMGLSQKPSLPWFDLSRLQLSHSYSIGFFSGNGTSGSRGMYSGTLMYKIADPLTLTLNVGILHDPVGLFSNNGLGQKAVVLPSGWIDWRPSKNFMLSVGFETLPVYDRSGYYSSWRYPYWYR